jgi:hypothetical protein
MNSMFSNYYQNLKLGILNGGKYIVPQQGNGSHVLQSNDHTVINQ